MLTPPAASIETVKAVCSGASFFAAIRLRPSLRQRSGVSARQISPRASLAMKLTASGVANCAAITRSPSFSRSSPSQTTTILPRRISSIASSIVAKGLPESCSSAAVTRRRRSVWLVMSVSLLTLMVPFPRMVTAAAPRTWRSRRPRRSAGRRGPRMPRLVRSSVSGISETSTQVGPSSATVRLTPLRATEPLSTT